MENHSAETTTWTSDELSTVGGTVDGIADARARSTTLKLVPRS